MGSFGYREYQLYLLSMMRRSGTVAEAFAKLDSSWEELEHVREEAERIGLLNPAHTVDLELSILGEPAIEYETPPEANPSNFFPGSRTLSFPMDLFGEFDYLLNATPEGIVWKNRFSRRAGTATPPLRSFEDLLPWRFVKDEVLAALANPEWEDGFNFFENYLGTLPHQHGGQDVGIVARFDFDLLQTAFLDQDNP